MKQKVRNQQKFGYKWKRKVFTAVSEKEGVYCERNVVFVFEGIAGLFNCVAALKKIPQHVATSREWRIHVATSRKQRISEPLRPFIRGGRY